MIHPQAKPSPTLLNPGGGNTPKLAEIEPAPGGDPGSFLTYGFDLAGNQTTVAASSEESVGRTSFLDYSAESRLAQLHTSDGTGTTELLYDGRGFLRRSRLTFSGSPRSHRSRDNARAVDVACYARIRLT